MRKSQYMTADVINKFKEAVPELCGEVPLEEDKKYIIFGAGVYGERAARDLGRKAVFFCGQRSVKRGYF